MMRNAAIGALFFGLFGALTGYVWTAFEFPFVILLPAFIGWFAVTLPGFGIRKSLWAALVGGVSFTAVFFVAIFFALTDGSPVALSAWMAATVAAAIAGALTGAVVAGKRGATVMAGFSAVGMLVATAVVGLVRAVAPNAIDTPGTAQFVYAALILGIVGTIVGTAAGLAASRPAGDSNAVELSRPEGPGQPHPA